MPHIVRIPDNKQGAGHATEGTNDAFLTSVLGPHTVRQISYGKLTRITDIGPHRNSTLAPAAFGAQPTPTASLLVQGAHQAYAAHLGFGLRPEVVWFAVVSEIGEHIRQNPAVYQTLLGPDWDNGPRIIYTHNWDQSNLYSRFYDQLTDILGKRLGELFAPPLSTVDTDERIALIAAFMRSTGRYHTYQLPAQCKIPHIEVEGTPEDWQMLYQKAGELGELFPPLEGYLSVVSRILHSIYCDIAGVEINMGNFWERLYEWKDDPDGPFVRGWITGLFAHSRMPEGKPVLRDELAWWEPSSKGMLVGQFASHITSIPILKVGGHDQSSPMHDLIAGILGIKLTRTDDLQVLTPRLGWGVVNV